MDHKCAVQTTDNSNLFLKRVPLHCWSLFDSTNKFINGLSEFLVIVPVNERIAHVIKEAGSIKESPRVYFGV